MRSRTRGGPPRGRRGARQGARSLPGTRRRRWRVPRAGREGSRGGVGKTSLGSVSRSGAAAGRGRSRAGSRGKGVGRGAGRRGRGRRWRGRGRGDSRSGARRAATTAWGRLAGAGPEIASVGNRRGKFARGVG